MCVSARLEPKKTVMTDFKDTLRNISFWIFNQRKTYFRIFLATFYYGDQANKCRIPVSINPKHKSKYMDVHTNLCIRFAYDSVLPQDQGHRAYSLSNPERQSLRNIQYSLRSHNSICPAKCIGPRLHRCHLQQLREGWWMFDDLQTFAGIVEMMLPKHRLSVILLLIAEWLIGMFVPF